MATELKKELLDLLADNDTVKVLTTLGADGSPHSVVKQSLQSGADGNLLFLELLESSRTNKNLVRSIWYNRYVAVTLAGRDGRSFQIKGKPLKAHITGPLFLTWYAAVREKLGDVDLAAVWVIEPEEIINETYAVRKGEEEGKHPYFTHLDRLAKL